MPFTLTNLKEDLEDLGSNFDGAPDLEFRAATKALELEQSGLTYQRVPPERGNLCCPAWRAFDPFPAGRDSTTLTRRQL